MTTHDLVETLRGLADRQRELASAFRITGRFDAAQRHQARAEAFDEAAVLAATEHYERLAQEAAER
jgi:hypothetical protein